MKIIFKVLLATCVFATLDAALPPGATDGLLSNANEILLVKVQASTPGGEAQNCYVNYAIDARVVAVNQTSLGWTNGDTIGINSYTVERESTNCKAWAGPLPPPKLERGWCGYVYLNEDSDGGMELAAYGHSFISEPNLKDCQEAELVEADGNVGSSGASRHTFIVDMAVAIVGLSIL